MRKTFILGLLLAAAIFALDQWTKNLVLSEFAHEGMGREIFSFFNLVLVWNHGISFGMLAGRDQPLLLAGVSLAVSLALIVWLWREAKPIVSFGLGNIIGGALANGLDRLSHGAVVDFLDFHLGTYHWPAFNVADSAIFIGVVLLCVSSMFMQPPHSDKGLPS